MRCFQATEWGFDMFDFHIHSEHSPDSVQTLDEICRSAIDKGLRGIAICDHVDMWFFDRENTYTCMQNCICDVRRVKEKYGNTLEIFQGVEMAEYLYDPKRAESILQLCAYDVILGSVHSVIYEDITDSYSRIDFSDMTESKIYGFLSEYFSKIIEMIEKTNFDVLSHLTCPLRYINGKYGRNIDILRWKNEIFTIFEWIVKKGIALEVNASGVGDFYRKYMPDENLLHMYKEIGGELITIGSDAHTPQKIGNVFAQTKQMLGDIGFGAYYYYKERTPRAVAI